MRRFYRDISGNPLRQIARCAFSEMQKSHASSECERDMAAACKESFVVKRIYTRIRKCELSKGIARGDQHQSR
ncbi:hypothetical protein DUT91_00305 [Phyllobacterium salinisoli]|uniref:Uncharacterized protein n=1 Tax=Phyllobacterium salinisoli TaxID=1899321 RepID=A0A368KA61_9HYPH|nr:hypothetical protein DUT91_00305 [Phyllobacterium salinisoli]